MISFCMLTTLLYPPSCSIYIKSWNSPPQSTMCANFYFFSFLMSSVVSSHPSTPTTAVCLDISLVSELFPLIVLWTFSRHNFNSIICKLLNSLDVLVINCCGSSMLILLIFGHVYEWELKHIQNCAELKLRQIALCLQNVCDRVSVKSHLYSHSEWFKTPRQGQQRHILNRVEPAFISLL